MKKSAGKGRSSCFSIYKQASKTKKQPKTTDAGIEGIMESLT